MRKTMIFLTVTMILLGLLSSQLVMAMEENPDLAVRQTSPNSATAVTSQELKDMSEFLEKMASGIKSGNSTPELETNSAIILIQLSHILDAMANPDDRVTYYIEMQPDTEVEKEWNLWDEMEEH